MFVFFIIRQSRCERKTFEGDRAMTFDATAAKDFLSVPDLAQSWGVTEQHLYNLIKFRRLPAYRVGRRLIVRKADAQSFLERNATASAAA